MGRERCLFCDGFIFDGEDVTRPASLGLTVHRHCYLRDAGIETHNELVERRDSPGGDELHDC
jgi:hypothetical protein